MAVEGKEEAGGGAAVLPLAPRRSTRARSAAASLGPLADGERLGSGHVGSWPTSEGQFPRLWHGHRANCHVSPWNR